MRYEQVNLFAQLKFENAQEIARAAIDAFTERRGRQRVPGLQRVQVGDGRSSVAVEQLLPIPRMAYRPGRSRRRPPVDYLYEPKPEDLFAHLLPSHVEVQVFRALLESNAAFYAAQMTAMDAATRNSGDMIEPDALHEQGPPGGHHA